MHLEAVAFDIDGTLYPNIRMYYHAFPSFFMHPRLMLNFARVRKEIRKHPVREPFRDAQARMLSRNLGSDYSRVVKLVEEKLYKSWEHSFRGLKPLPGVRETLLYFRRKGLRLAALSDFPVERKLAHLGLEDLMDIAFCSEDSGNLKPHEAPFRRLIHDLDAPPEKILYVGNSYRYDIEGASAVGMRTAWYTRNRDKGAADFAFSRYRELRSWVEEILGGAIELTT